VRLGFVYAFLRRRLCNLAGARHPTLAAAGRVPSVALIRFAVALRFRCSSDTPEQKRYAVAQVASRGQAWVLWTAQLHSRLNGIAYQGVERKPPTPHRRALFEHGHRAHDKAQAAPFPEQRNANQETERHQPKPQAETPEQSNANQGPEAPTKPPGQSRTEQRKPKPRGSSRSQA
jgi:hypothetical protein